MDAPNQEPAHSRFGLFGDVPTRLMTRILRSWPSMPRFIEEVIICASSLAIYLLATEQRHAIQRNLKHIWQDSAYPERWLGGLRVFYNFAWTYVDSLRLRLGQRQFQWDIEGMEHFTAMRDSTDACLIFTTHTGNYDLAAALFSEKFRRIIHTVRVPERTEHLQEIRKKELDLDQVNHPNFKVHYNTSEDLLGIELAGLLHDKEIVAIQCDRVFGSVSPLTIPSPGTRHHFRLPKGPMVLGAISKCPCVPLYVVRSGYLNYKIIIEPALSVQKQPGARRVQPEDYAAAWQERLLPFLRNYATQWLVFEHAFTQD